MSAWRRPSVPATPAAFWAKVRPSSPDVVAAAVPLTEGVEAALRKDRAEREAAGVRELGVTGLTYVSRRVYADERSLGYWSRPREKLFSSSAQSRPNRSGSATSSGELQQCKAWCHAWLWHRRCHWKSRGCLNEPRINTKTATIMLKDIHLIFEIVEVG